MSSLDLQREQMWQNQQGGWQGAGQVGAGPGFQQQMLQQLQNQQRQGQRGGLPPGGLDQQLQSINSYYDMVRDASITMPSYSGLGSLMGGGPQAKQIHIGFDPQAYQASMLGGVGQEQGVSAAQTNRGYGNDLNSLARKLATAYGLALPRGQIVDESGNLLTSPDQLQAMSGGKETIGSAAAKMNYLSAAVKAEMNKQQQQKGIAALQSGLGQIQKRGRGSLAAMQSGYYQDLADMYSNQEYKAVDYSYFIEKERMDLAAELDRRARETAKSRSRTQFWAGAAITVAGLWTGNIGAAAQGFSMSAGAWEDTGYEEKWF